MYRINQIWKVEEGYIYVLNITPDLSTCYGKKLRNFLFRRVYNKKMISKVQLCSVGLDFWIWLSRHVGKLWEKGKKCTSKNNFTRKTQKAEETKILCLNIWVSRDGALMASQLPFMTSQVEADIVLLWLWWSAVEVWETADMRTFWLLGISFLPLYSACKSPICPEHFPGPSMWDG